MYEYLILLIPQIISYCDQSVQLGGVFVCECFYTFLRIKDFLLGLYTI